MILIISMVVLLILTIIAWRRGWKWKALYPFGVSCGVGYFASWFSFIDAIAAPIALCLMVWLVGLALTRPESLKELRRNK